jgi:hypothetical protein
MDFSEIIGKLKDERRRLDIAIATMEKLASGDDITSPSTLHTGKRGRPAGQRVSDDERQRISAGMRKYWENRKSAQPQEQATAVIADAAVEEQPA